MAEYNYIHIALRGEVDNAIRTIYSFPEVAENRTWEKMLVTPAAAIKRFLNASECYIIQQDANGHYFSLITRDLMRNDGSYVMISVMVENGCSLTGRQLQNLFSRLKKTLVDDPERDDVHVRAALEEAGVPENPVMLSSWTYAPRRDENEPREDAAYRTYISLSELETIFSFPSQPDYEAYRCIIVVPATSSLRPGIKMHRITGQIRKQYTLVCPEGVTASAEAVYDGDRVTLTYEKQGFDAVTEKVTVGTPSAYLRVEGSTIRVKAPVECGIRFVRRIPLTVSSAKGSHLNGYTISINGRPVNTMEPFIEFTEKDLTPGAEVDIKVASNNYTPLKLVKPADELLSTDELHLTLQPVEQGVTLRLDFGDGRVIEQYISIEKNTPEYNRLHSGNFHGFRAHRVVTPDHSEVYNVDVRFNGRPVAPNFVADRAPEPAAADDDEETPATTQPAGQQQHVAPVFENISDQSVADAPEIDTKVPTVGTGEPADETTEEVDTEEIHGSRRTRWILAAAAAVILLVVVLVFVLPLGEKLDTAPTATVTPDDAVTAVDSTATAGTTAAGPVVSSIDPADVAYLNDNTVWNLTGLKSEGARALVSAIADGDIEALVNNDYFAVAGQCTNSTAASVADLAWKASGSPTERSLRKAMKDAVKNGSVDMRRLSDQLARRQPRAEEANTSPRPTRR